jgi:DNA-binding response OmpR family regulator
LRAGIGTTVSTDKLMTLLPRSKADKALMVHISKLRAKISNAFTITNIKGKGYRLDAA